MAEQALKPAAELAAKASKSFPNDSAEYRKARAALLAEEIELRRHAERVAEQRRALRPAARSRRTTPSPPRMAARSGFPRCSASTTRSSSTTTCSARVASEPCPMCTTLLDAWDGLAPHLQERVALAIVARSPAERLAAFKRERGWRFCRFIPRRTTASTTTMPSRRRRGATSPRSTSSSARTARSVIRGATRWVTRPLIPARIRAAPSTHPLLWSLPRLDARRPRDRLVIPGSKTACGQAPRGLGALRPDAPGAGDGAANRRAAALERLLSDVRTRRREFAERKRLARDIVELMKRAGVFCMLVARRFGGDEAAPSDFYRLVERIATATVQALGRELRPRRDLSGGAACRDARGNLRSWPRHHPGGRHLPAQTAVPTEGGFKVDGRWSWAAARPPPT